MATEQLDASLVHHAFASQRADLAHTYLALQGDAVAGYVSLTTGSVRREDAPRRYTRGMPRRPTPTILIARLGCDQRRQGRVRQVLLTAAERQDILTRMDDLCTTRGLLSRQLAEAIATDPVGALPTIVALQRETDEQLREAVRRAALGSSWREIAAALGVSKQAAHQRFKGYAQDVTGEIKTEHKAMKQARRRGDTEQGAQARARRDELTAQLRTAARALKDQG